MPVLCPFCGTHAERSIHCGEHWWITPNRYPYKGFRHHLLVVPFRHILSIRGVMPDESAELFTMLQWAEKHFQIPGGGVLMRFGDPAYNESSVPHLHLHIVVPDGTVELKTIFYRDRPPGMMAPSFREPK